MTVLVLVLRFGEAQICGDLCPQKATKFLANSDNGTDMSGVSEAGLAWLFNTANLSTLRRAGSYLL